MSYLSWDEYQEFVGRMAVAPKGWKEHDLALVGLGLGGEAGEVADDIKKHLYHNKPLDRANFLKELGDVLWYITLGAIEVDSSLAEVAQGNVDKLSERYPERVGKRY